FGSSSWLRLYGSTPTASRPAGGAAAGGRPPGWIWPRRDASLRAMEGGNRMSLLPRSWPHRPWSHRSWMLGAGLLALLGAARPSRAVADGPVDLALVLAVDSSVSVAGREYGLQIRGLAVSFRDPAVQAAIAGGPLGSIAVTVVEWSGR